jgi:hypothetical protein
MSAEFNTTEYEFAHGRKPRGSGTWAFTPHFGWGSCPTAPLEGIVWVTDTYANAKRECARQHPDITRWVVLS